MCVDLCTWWYVLVSRCSAGIDNVGSVYINDQDVFGAPFRKSAGPRTWDLPAGKCVIKITAMNEGSAPNPAGIWCVLRDALTQEIVYQTDDSWTCVVHY